MRRISLLPSAKEIIAALGRLEQLFRITHALTTSSIRARERATACDLDDRVPPLARFMPRFARSRARDGPFTHRTKRAFRHCDPHVIFTQALGDVSAVAEMDGRALATRLSPSPAVIACSESRWTA